MHDIFPGLSLTTADRFRLPLTLSLLCVLPLALLQFWTFEPHNSGFEHTVHGLGYAASSGWPFPSKTTYSSFHSGEIFEARSSWLALQTNAGFLFTLFLGAYFSLKQMASQKQLQISDLLAMLSAIAVLIVTYRHCQLWTKQNHWSLYYGTAETRPAYPDWPFWNALVILGLFVYSATGKSLRQFGQRSAASTG